MVSILQSWNDYPSSRGSFYPAVSFTQGAIWANIHLGTAILCSCLPTYRPLFAHVAASNSSPSTRIFSNLSGSQCHSASAEVEYAYPIDRYSKAAAKRYEAIDDLATNNNRFQPRSFARTSIANDPEGGKYIVGNQMNVQTRVEVVRNAQ